MISSNGGYSRGSPSQVTALEEHLVHAREEAQIAIDLEYSAVGGDQSIF